MIGGNEMINAIRYSYLDNYERYIFVKLFQNSILSAYDLNKMKIQLSDYYRFLICFEQKPLIFERENNEIIEDYSDENTHRLEEYGMREYNNL